jgi:ParB family chromosome partitioning protein
MKAGEMLKAKFGAGMRESAGIGATVPTGIPSPVVDEKLKGASVLRKSFSIPLDRITPDPKQPRKEFDEVELARLAESLRTRGQLQPIRARWDETMIQWVIVVGERRWRAARLAGLTHLQIIEASADADDHDRLVDQLVENALREDLKPVERARAYQTLLQAKGWSHRQLAQELAIAPSAVAQALALLDLPEAIQVQVEQGGLAPSVAYEVAKVEDAAEQARIVDKVLTEGLTRAEVAEVIRRTPMKKGKAPSSRKKPRKVTSRSWRLPAGTVTAELRRGKGEGLAALLELLRLTVAAAEFELAEQGGDAAAA